MSIQKTHSSFFFFYYLKIRCNFYQKEPNMQSKMTGSCEPMSQDSRVVGKNYGHVARQLRGRLRPIDR